MASKTIQISARISHEDAEFISQLKIEGAKTPSDKLRSIITDARSRHDGMHDYSGCYKSIQNLILPVLEKIRHLELDCQQHSDFVIRFLEWAPDIIAYAVSSIPAKSNENTQNELIKYEKELVKRVFRLFTSALQMGITPYCPCYDPKIISKEIDPILALTDIINSTQNKEKAK